MYATDGNIDTLTPICLQVGENVLSEVLPMQLIDVINTYMEDSISLSVLSMVK